MSFLYPKIHGTVFDSDSHEPLVGVNIIGINVGTASDNEGRFIIDVETGAELTFSHIGYSKVKAIAQNDMIIKMKYVTLQSEEIFVLAGLKAESLQKSTSSVTVINTESIKRADGSHFQNVMEIIPNLNSAGGTSRPRYFQIRGIGERSHYFAEGPPNISVGFVMDDIDLSGLGMVGFLYDLEQVEVFKGPQSAMYGPNALAGLISMRSRKPTHSFETHFRLTGGSDNIQRLNGMVNIPFGNSFSYRIAMESGSSDGFRTNKFFNKTNTNERNETIIREKLLFIPNNNFNAILTFFNANLDNKYDAWAPDNNKVLFTYTNQQGIDSQETNAFSLRTNYSQNKLNITLIASKSETDLVHAYDGDWGNDIYWSQEMYYWNDNNPVFQDTIKQPWGYYPYDFFDKNDRTRMVNSFESRISYSDFILGYYFKSLKEIDKASGWLYGGDATNANSQFDLKTSAIYSQTEKIVSQKIKIMSNIRLESNNFIYNGDANYYGIPLDSVNFDINHNLLGGKLALQYFVNDDMNMYGSISRGYKAGGVNQHPVLTAENRPYNPEFMTNYELGLRRYTDKTILHLSAFMAKRQDQQVSISSQQTEGDPNSFVFYTANATTGSLSGMELDGTYRLNLNLTLSGSVGLLNTHVDAFTFESDSGVTTTLGDRFAAHAPKYSFNLALDYKREKGFFSRVGLSGKDKFYFSDSHDEISKPYQLINGYIGWKFSNWSVKLWVRNILDTRHATRGFYFGLEPVWDEDLQDHEYPDKKYVSFGDPAHFGVTVDYGF